MGIAAAQEPASDSAPGLKATAAESGVELAFDDGPSFTTAAQSVQNVRTIQVGESEFAIGLWDEVDANQGTTHWYAIYRADSQSVQRFTQTSYVLRLRSGEFDPLTDGAPVFEKSALPASGEVAIVQFWCQPLDEMRAAVTLAGGKVGAFLSDHAHLVTMDSSARKRVAALPFVRWVGDYRAEMRLEPELYAAMLAGKMPQTTRVYVQVHERGPAQKAVVADRIRALGGRVDLLIDEGFRLEATLTADQMAQICAMDQVLYIDRWSAPETDMNNVRELGGANYVESVAGFTGSGLRCEVMDGNIRETHVDFQVNPVIFHGPHSGDNSHGTPVSGIVFGTGASDINGRGMLPDAQGIFADYDLMTNRYTHTAELITPTYQVVFQTNSWGGGLTTAYTSTSMEMDDIILQNDIVITQSQSNTGNQQSRPQAWAKNIVSVGGIEHQDTLTRTDDAWNGSGSIGPAADGRLKPDLSYFYESIYTAAGSSTTAHTQFGGTSAATPMTAGHFGIFFQMWSAGIFGNPTPGATIFANRPHAATAKAFMIAGASPYTFSGAGHDLTRVHQGWGLANVQRLYDDRDKFYVVNESIILTALQSSTHPVYVTAGEPELRVAMVYQDVAGTTSSTVHRINDLNLRVVSPTGLIYHGNVGLNTANWSTAGGAPNNRDTVECVLVQAPEAGLWQLIIEAAEINGDSHLETPANDADFALVALGVDDALVGCNMAAVASPAYNQVSLVVDAFSRGGPIVNLLFEYSLDSGATWQICTPAPASPLSNPAIGIATGISTFIWNAVGDGVGATGPSSGVLARATASDGIAPLPTGCTSNPFDVFPVPPSCTIVGPAGAATMDIAFPLTLASPNAGAVEVRFDFSTDGGVSFLPCTAAAASPLANPALAVPVGAASFSWDSEIDGVALLVVMTDVRVRATVDDGVAPETGLCNTTSFTVDNVPPPPTCSINAPLIASAFNVTPLSFDATSPNGPTVDLTFSFSTDGGASFALCTAAASSSVANPAADRPNGTGTFEWNTVADLVAFASIEPDVIVRLVALDGISPQSGTCQTPPFVADNRAPRCTIAARVAIPGSPAWGEVTIDLNAESSHGSNVIVNFEFTTNGGTNWRICTAAPTSPRGNPGASAPLGPSIFLWDSRADGVGLSAAAAVMIRAGLIDSVAPVSGSCVSAQVSVDNTVRCGGTCGDCDLNIIGPDVLDALAAARIAAGVLVPSGNQLSCCDVNSSDTITIIDSLSIAQQAVSLPVTLTCP